MIGGLIATIGVLDAIVLPMAVAATSFLAGFVGISVTGLIALFGPRTSRRRLEEVSR